MYLNLILKKLSIILNNSKIINDTIRMKLSKYNDKKKSMGKVLLKSLSPNRDFNQSIVSFDKQLARVDISTWMGSPHDSRFESK